MQKRLAFVPGVREQLENEYSGRDSLWGAGYTIEGEGVKDPSDEQAPGVVPLSRLLGMSTEWNNLARSPQT